jgi:hypothetical protein
MRFVSEDPIDFLGGYNVYRYVVDNPVNLVDPLGLDSCLWFGYSGSFGLGIGGQYVVEIGICTDDCGRTKLKKGSASAPVWVPVRGRFTKWGMIHASAMDGQFRFPR